MAFVKGQSGNPAGRPKGATGIKTDLLYVYKKLFSEPIIKEDSSGHIKKIKLTPQQELLASMWKMYKDENTPIQVRAKIAESLLPYLFSKPAQEVEVSADVQSTVTDRSKPLKEMVDKLTPEEREMYLELCEKVNDEK